MKSNDIRTRDEIRTAMQKAISNNDTEGFYSAFDEMLCRIESDIKQDYESKFENVKQESDARVLSARGVRQLTTKENEYYIKISEAMKARDPKQALSNLGVVMPETIFESVFDDLRTRHPLLSKIKFISTTGAIKMIMNTNPEQLAAWGTLCSDIVKELSSGFKEVDTSLMKLSAFIPVCKAMLDLGPTWLDSYVREVLYEALSIGLEAGLVTGTGKNQPIGMDRQVGDGVTVTDGVYPRKPAITVNDFTPKTIGKLVSLMARNEKGKSRNVSGLVLIVNPQDYFEKVMPATTLMAPDGSYRNDVMPYPMEIVQSSALARGDAILGVANRYFAAAGTAIGGKIEYSDDYRFLEDERVYLIKIYANGTPMDNNDFLLLDIDGLRPVSLTVHTADAPTPSNVATLSSLKIGALTLSPAFSGSTDTYTTTTTNASNVITAVPTDASAEVVVKVGTKEIENGSAYTWATGENVVTVQVTAEDGTTTKTYTVTVTKS
jgi:HK97 family phage major capsid protein